MTAPAKPANHKQDADRLNWDSLVAEGKAAARSQWTLGDLAREVETSYGGGELERYAEEIGVAYQQLANYASISRAYELSVRTENLTWTHHERIASRPDRLAWLDLAEKGKWSVRQMLGEIETAEAEQRAEAERRRKLAELADQGEDLAAAVADGQMSIQAAMAELALRHEKAEQERRDHEGRIRRAKGRLESFLAGWIEFQNFRENPDRDEILAALLDHERAQVVAIEQQMWG